MNVKLNTTFKICTGGGFVEITNGESTNGESTPFRYPLIRGDFIEITIKGENGDC